MEARAVRHSAKVFGDVILMHHLSSDGDTGVSLSGSTTAIIVRDFATGWLEGYPAGPKFAEEVVAAKCVQTAWLLAQIVDAGEATNEGYRRAIGSITIRGSSHFATVGRRASPMVGQGAEALLLLA